MGRLVKIETFGNGEIGGQDVFALTFYFRKNFWFRELWVWEVDK